MTQKQQREVIRRVQEALGDEVICSRCGATLETYADKCNVDLATRCAGFERIEEVRNPIVREVYRFPTPKDTPDAS